MLDTDLSFAPDLAARLVRFFEVNKLDVLSGIYSYKVEPYLPVVFMHNADTGRHETMANWDKSLDLLPIDSAGAGILLIRRKVIERIRTELREHPFDLVGKGEDHSFFMKLRKLDIRAWCAPHVEADHLNFWGIRTSVDYISPEKFDHHFERALIGA